jgi:hypothetical protein
MLSFWHKAAAVVLGTVGISGLAMTGSASARVPSVTLTVCNTAANAQTFLVYGTNENEENGVVTPTLTVSGHGCTLVSKYLWATGQTLAISHQIGQSAMVHSPIDIPASVPDGGGQTATITAFGPL